MNPTTVINYLNNKALELNKKDTRTMRVWPVGKAVRQGDVYIHRVADDFIVGDVLDIRQIVEGTSIGSRHILIGDVKVYESKKLPSYVNNKWPLGYSFDVGNEGATVTHPEHAHINICVPGRYVVTHQMDIVTMQRVSD